MHLDRGQAGDVERVADRVRVVGPRAGVQDEPVGQRRRAVEQLAELALVVRLRERQLESELAPEVVDPRLELRQREAAVQLRVAPLEHVEVHAVDHLDAVLHGECTSSTAASTSASPTTCPWDTSPGACTSTNGTSDPRRFLSRPTSSTTSRGEAPEKLSGSPRAASSSDTSRRSASRPDSRSAARSPMPTASPWR